MATAQSHGSAPDGAAPRMRSTSTGIGPSSCLVYVLHGGNLYGTEKMGLVTVEALGEYQRRVILAPPAWAGGSVPAVLDSAAEIGLEAVRFDDRRSLAGQLWGIFRREPSVDVITTSITQSLLVTTLAAAAGTHLRHLHAVHGGHTTNYGWKRLLLPLNVRFMAVSTHVKQILIDSGVPEGRIVVAENFVDDRTDSSVPTRATYVARGLRADGAPIRVVLVGRADPVKRLDLVIDAVATGELQDMCFDIFGAGPDLDELRSMALPFDNVLFHGYDADVASRLATADIFLHTCEIETFGLVVLEAFQAGVVVVVPDEGGTATLVEPGRTGLLYRARDVPDMVRALRRAASLAGEELDAMASTARGELTARFSRDQGARVYRQAFNDLDGSPQVRRRFRSVRRPPGPHAG